ncbi:MAG: hypothetical protein U5K37_09615 [Natrialbaceae archaeon]|nr:hypothetical protein [Natrialbaceae archaeon]
MEGEQPTETTDELVENLTQSLVDAGIDRNRIEHQIEPSSDAFEDIAKIAEGHDVVVMGETDPSIATYIFGMPADSVADRFLGPVLVVQRPRQAD